MNFKKIVKRVYDKLPFKKEIFSILRPFPLPDSTLRHLHFQGVFRSRIDDQFFYMQHYGYQLENEIFWKGVMGGWEKTTLKIWIDLSRQSDYIVDAGANTGLFSLLAKTINREAHVFAFEPVNRVYLRMKNNFRLNNFTIQSEMVALSDADGKALIYDLPTDHIYSVTINENRNAPGIKTIPTEVNIITLDSYVAKMKLPRIDLMKIDVEGHEPAVVSGGLKIIAAHKPAMIVEVLNESAASALQGITHGLGYLNYFINETSNRAEPRETINCGCFGNFLLCTSAHALRLKI